MSNVIALDGGTVAAVGAPNPALIAVLERALEDARLGHLQSFVGTGFSKDGLRYACWADNHPNIYEMMGALAWLQHEYAHRITEHGRD